VVQGSSQFKDAKMIKKYIAVCSIGEVLPGQEIKGLSDERIQALLASGAIEEEKAPEQPKDDGTAAQLSALEAEIAGLKASESKLLAENAEAVAEIAGLKAKVEELEKATPAENKPATKPKEQTK